MAALDREHQVARRRDVAGHHMHIDAEVPRQHAARLADAAHAVERVIWDLWRKKPGSILVPGHDVPMRLENDEPVYIAKRTAGINAWFGRQMDETTLIELKV